MKDGNTSAYLQHNPTPELRKEGGLMTDSKPTTRLQQLIHRTDRVLAVMHAPTAAHTRLMALAGAKVALVGTSGVVGTYTGLADVGGATMTECLTIAG
jgi:2-methylisocitrate lyase-like PEP mutase family enzyme